MLVGPWAGEEEPAQSVLKEDDLRKNGSVSALQGQSPRHGGVLAGRSRTHTGSAVAAPSSQENPLWKSCVPRSRQLCPGKEQPLRSPGGTGLWQRCITPSAVKPNKPGQHPKNSGSFISSVIQQLPRKTKTSGPDCAPHSRSAQAPLKPCTSLPCRSSPFPALGRGKQLLSRSQLGSHQPLPWAHREEGGECPTRRGKHTLSI